MSSLGFWLSLLTAVGMVTPLRAAIILLVPVVLIAFIAKYKVNLPVSLSAFLGLTVMTTSLSVTLNYIETGQIYYIQHLVSVGLAVPLIVWWFLILDPNRNAALPSWVSDYVKGFPFALTIILGCCNVVGFVQFWQEYKGVSVQYDDAFIGFYGRSGIAMHGLAILNAAMAGLYLFEHNRHRTKINLVLSGFFALASAFCFYGLGLLIWLLAALITALIWRNLWQVLTILVGFAALFLITSIVSPKTADYTVSNIKVGTPKQLAHKPEQQAAEPRKVVLFKYYLNQFIFEPFRFWVGTGPGCFNSRVSFMLNGTYSSVGLINAISPKVQPYYASKYIHPMWSKAVLAKPYNDGTRNQPFSSVIAMLAEYGIIWCVVLAIFSANLLIKYFYRPRLIMAKEVTFLLLLTGLNLLVDNIAESSEFIVLMLLLGCLVFWSRQQHQTHADPHHP